MTRRKAARASATAALTLKAAVASTDPSKPFSQLAPRIAAHVAPAICWRIVLELLRRLRATLTAGLYEAPKVTAGLRSAW